MNYNALSIAAGALILYAITFIAITFLTFIYTAFAKNSHKLKAPKLFLGAAVATLAWEFIAYISVMFASFSGEFIYGLVAGFLVFGVLYFVSHKFLEFGTRDRIIYSLLVAIIINPVWLSVLGII